MRRGSILAPLRRGGRGGMRRHDDVWLWGVRQEGGPLSRRERVSEGREGRIEGSGWASEGIGEEDASGKKVRNWCMKNSSRPYSLGQGGGGKTCQMHVHLSYINDTR
ncbi:hypothetical protein AMTR_s00086p00126640 [Amborella trichopoda]|uniref:Uncharacterized protein n=1 Tax=Amborella trichopoda TaxID=13333 RepID=W1P4H0_AMBTC|nr:hypothetical protein AMTR_s00086p00126640 [Amborella trichopoda]